MTSQSAKRRGSFPAWIGLLLLMVGWGPPFAFAQTIRVLSSSGLHPHSLNGNTSITVSASPAGTGVSLVSKSQAVASDPITITVTLTNPASTTIEVYGAFGSASAALTTPSSSLAIPTRCIFGLVPTGVPTTYTAFTQTTAVGAPGAGLELLSISGLTANTTQNATLSLKIDLASMPNLPAGTTAGRCISRRRRFSGYEDRLVKRERGNRNSAQAEILRHFSAEEWFLHHQTSAAGRFTGAA